MKRAALVSIFLGSVLLVLWEFVRATTFFGDDYLFRAFAQLEQNPLSALVSDKHGGEYYRPLPLLLWWLLERIGGGRPGVFAIFAFAEHTACAALVVALGRRLGYSRFAAWIAGLLFLLAPAEREAALWFSASTDLLGTLAGLAACVCFLSERRVLYAASIALSAAAFLSKETLAILPGLLLLAFAVVHVGQGWLKRGIWRLTPHLVVGLAVLAARTAVLHGLGGANDTVAPGWGRAVQVVGGLLHSITAYGPLPDWVALLAGFCILLWATMLGRTDAARRRFAWLWVLIAVVPLPAAGWIVGARYFYLPAVGLFLLVAPAIERCGRLIAVFAAATLAVLGLASGYDRAMEVSLYRHAVTAIAAGISDGLVQGHRVFYVGGAVKDLDLALKLDRTLPASIREAVIIPDVPASFVWLPSALGHRLDFLLARPPLPPSGGYRFGGVTIAGLARREEAPDLAEVLARLPELRLLQLQRKGDGFAVVDRTSDYLPSN